MNVANRVAIVTGSGSGIGRDIVTRLARQGAKAVVVDISASAAETTAAAIREQGGTATAFACDVTAKAEVQEMMRQVVASLGTIDILVNNVGIVRDGYLTRITEADWDLVLDTNLKSYLPQVGDTEAKRKADAYFKEGYREFKERNYIRAKTNFEPSILSTGQSPPFTKTFGMMA